jgi:chromosome segregation ATPase
VRVEKKKNEDTLLEKSLIETESKERGKALEMMRAKFKVEQIKLSKAKAEGSNLEATVRALRRDRDRLQNQSEFDARTNEAALKHASSSLEGQVNGLKEKVRLKTEACEAMELQLAERVRVTGNEVESLKRVVDNLEEEKKELAHKNKTLSVRANELENELSSSLSDWNTDKKKLSTLVEHQHVLSSQMERLSTQMEVFKAETESLKSINTNLERELNEDTKHLSTLRNTLNEKDNLLRQTKEQIRELSDELESKQSIIRGLQADIEAHEDLSTHDNAHSTEMMPVMLKQPVDSAKLSELDHRIKALLFDNEGLRNKLQHTKNELETARKNMQKQQ